MEVGVAIVMQNPNRQQADHQVYWEERRLARANTWAPTGNRPTCITRSPRARIRISKATSSTPHRGAGCTAPLLFFLPYYLSLEMR